MVTVFSSGVRGRTISVSLFFAIITSPQDAIRSKDRGCTGPLDQIPEPDRNDGVRIDPQQGQKVGPI